MMIFPEPSCKTTLAIALFLRPVPMIFWAANPPGSLDFTNFSKSAVSKSASATAAEEATMRAGNLGAVSIKERGFDWETEWERRGFCEIWEEKEREDNDEVIAEIEIAIAMAADDGGASAQFLWWFIDRWRGVDVSCG